MLLLSPGEIAFSIFSIPIYYYGLIMGASLIVGVFTANFITKKFYPMLNPEIIYDISPYIIIGAIIGARLYYCVLSYQYFIQNPLEIFEIWNGGLTIHGGILGGIIGGYLYAKKHKLPILKLCDIFSYGLCLGQALGRWGNFFNSEAFGMPTDGFLKLYIPIYKRPVEYLQYDYFHPTFLYESILDVFIFLILFFVIRKIIEKKKATSLKVNLKCEKAPNYDGIIFFSYLILYSIVRIFVEQIRIDSVLNIFGIPVAQLVSLIITFISIISIFVIRLKNENCR